MRNVARIDNKLVVYKANGEIVGVLDGEEWRTGSTETYQKSDLKEAKDLTLAEVKCYVNGRFAVENNSAAVNSNVIVKVENGNLVVTFPSNFVTYENDEKPMPDAGYNVTAHLDYAELFGEAYEGKEGYSFKIKSYLLDLNEDNVVLVEL